ncbi:hypothetical protein [Thiomicrorhabdus sediminis]|uniref:Uncharacterized protein n=1 Tax=Thiomicrorhabdus sediminis TaxID=2580412 RepID=A0A4P9K412_9GAMM|nr:hypothetical protein [Thiomicrorhabdus sediminis]QCU89664.1 hypothetical protein FE785_02930 [Thiomicrorhabdus sediminis]
MDNQLYEEQIDPNIPTAEEMLRRLHSIDVHQFNMREIAHDLKGDHIWISVLTVPVSAIVLVSATLIGGFVFDSPIIAFLSTAAILYWIGRMYDGQENNYRLAAREEVMRRIGEIEGEFGLLYHFRHFLPQKYRHLCQSVRKRKYLYIEQYIQAILLLQKRLNEEKFTHIWHLTYPHLNPDYEEDGDLEQAQS